MAKSELEILKDDCYHYGYTEGYLDCWESIIEIITKNGNIIDSNVINKLSELNKNNSKYYSSIRKDDIIQ